MKAEDTIMSQEQRNEATRPYIQVDRFRMQQNLLEAQAEISFKAGYEERELVEVPLADLLERSYKEGIKTVVEWIENNKEYIYGLFPVINSQAWQAFKGSKGIES